MKCRIKKGSLYYHNHIGLGIQFNHWGYREYAKIFRTVEEAKAEMKVFKIKGEIEKCK